MKSAQRGEECSNPLTHDDYLLQIFVSIRNNSLKMKKKEAIAVDCLKGWLEEKRPKQNAANASDHCEKTSTKSKSTFSASNPWGEHNNPYDEKLGKRKLTFSTSNPGPCSRRRCAPLEDNNTVIDMTISPLGANEEDSALPPPPAPTIGESSSRPRGGPIFLMTRVLTDTDMSPHHNRLSMPLNQVIPAAQDFLTTHEIDMLERPKQFLPIKLIVDKDSATEKTYVSHLRKTPAGPKTFSYGIGKPWNKIVKNHGFQRGTAVNIWADHSDDNEVLIILERIESSPTSDHIHGKPRRKKA